MVSIDQYIAAASKAWQLIGGAITTELPDEAAQDRVYRAMLDAAKLLDPVTDRDDTSDSVATFLRGLIGIASHVDPFEFGG